MDETTLTLDRRTPPGVVRYHPLEIMVTDPRRLWIAYLLDGGVDVKARLENEASVTEPADETREPILTEELNAPGGRVSGVRAGPPS
jgi:hypothetical protein